MPVVEKIYKVAAGELKIKITYWSTANGVLDFGVINIGELEYGYEDEDQLTFFPNVFRMEFTDFDRKNYDILKKSFEAYPQKSLKDICRVQVILNGKEIYDGYIDQETLSYNEDERVTSFEAVDFILELKNFTTFNINKALYPLDYADKLVDMPSVIWQIYKKIYPELPDEINITSNLNVFNSAGFKGIYWDHDWMFVATKPPVGGHNPEHVHVDWKTNPFKPVFAFYKLFWQDQYPFGTLAELIRQLGKEFGALLGSTAKNKIFFIKKNGSVGQDPSALDAKIISGTLTKTLHLRKIDTIVNNNVFIGASESAGTLFPIPFPSNPGRTEEFIPINKYSNLEIATYFATDTHGGNPDPSWWDTNVLINNDGDILKVGKGIYDPSVSNLGCTIQELITKSNFNWRRKGRDKYEMELYGTDYELFKSYIFNLSPNGSVYLRPMVIKKNLLTNTTSMTALEVGL